MLNHFILDKVMVKNPVCMGPDDRLGEAVVKMVYSGYGCLPIVDHTKTLVGFLTRGDILKLMSMVHLSSS